MGENTNETPLATVVIFGDLHLCDRDYGQHNDYPAESLWCMEQMCGVLRDTQATHCILTGDLSYGTFRKLEYRDKVNQLLWVMNSMVNNNLYCVKGNHDSASYGMTEYEYYVGQGLLRPSERLRIGSTEFLMVDYGKEKDESVAKPTDEPKVKTLVVAHNWFNFEGNAVPSGIKMVNLTNHPYWGSIEGIISGHIHQHSYTEGYIKTKGTSAANDGSTMKKIFVWQLPCFARPQYLEDRIQHSGVFAIVKVYEKKIMIDSKELQLWPIEKSFNLTLIAEKKAAKEEKEEPRIDIRDIVQNLAEYTSSFANPEDIILATPGVDDKVKNKAVELLKSQGRSR